MDFQVEEPAFSTMRDVPQDDNPVCTHSERCQGCPYPAHGFICNYSDGSCMKTIVNKNTERKENTP